MALAAAPHSLVAATAALRRHRVRHGARCGRHAVRGATVRAASDTAGDPPSSTRVEFEGRILQDVRAGQEGFATTLRVAAGSPGAAPGEGASVGDLVTVAYTAAVTGDDDGPDTQLQDPDEPLTFEVGAADAVGNPLFQAFDAAVRGLGVGDSATVQAQGGEYDKALLFPVPRSHEEVVRLEGEHAQGGGLREGLVVQLANGEAAVVRRVDDATVLLDCNHPLAGAPLTFRLTVLALERGAADA